MPLKWESWDGNASNNNAAPPTGAPEGGVRNKQVNDILRYVMAAVSEIGQWLTVLELGLGTMSAQDADAVEITGGTILNTGIGYPNLIDAGSLTSGIIPDGRFPAGVPNASKLGTLTPQQWYDLVYPIGHLLLTTDEGYNPNGHVSSLTGSGLAATWSLINLTAYLKILSVTDYTGSPGALQQGGLATGTTAAAGTHSHTGDTGLHTLSIAEMPTHTHSYQGATNTGLTSGYQTDGTVQNNAFAFSGERGGNAAHSHPITADGSHTHTVPLTPTFVATLAWRRTA